MKLRRIRFFFISLILIVVISPACSKSPEDQAVTELIEKASHLVGEAAELRDENPAESDRLESEALSNLEEAVSNYPSSSIVAELDKGEILIGPYTMSGLREVVAARIEIEAAAAGEEEEIELDPLTRAAILAEEPGPPYLKAIVLAHLEEKYREAGDAGRALDLMADALATAETIEEDYFKSRALAIVSEQYKLSGEETRALEILDNARELAEGIKYPYFQSGALAEIAGCSVKSGKYEDALRAIEKMEDPYFRADSLTEVAGEYIRADNRDSALPLLAWAEAISGEIDIPHFRAEVLAEIAVEYIAAGEGDKGAALLATALELVERLDDLVSRSEALVVIGRGYTVAGEGEKAIELLSLANESAAAIKNNLFKDQALQKIAEQYIAMGEYERASRIEETIEDARSKALIFAALAESYNSLGDKEQSQVFVRRTIEASDIIKNPLFQADVLIRISPLYQPPPSPIVGELDQDRSSTP